MASWQRSGRAVMGRSGLRLEGSRSMFMQFLSHETSPESGRASLIFLQARFLAQRERLVARGIAADAHQPEWCYQNEELCYLKKSN